MRIGWLLLALAGCGGSGPPAGPNIVGPEPGPAAPLSEEIRAMLDSVERAFREPGTVTARLNEEVQVGTVRVRPLAILADTRCPIDLDCAHGGQIRVRVAVGGVGEREMELRTPLAVPGGQLRLVAVAPPRWHRMPAGVNPNAPARFGFRPGGADPGGDEHTHGIPDAAGARAKAAMGFVNLLIGWAVSMAVYAALIVVAMPAKATGPRRFLDSALGIGTLLAIPGFLFALLPGWPIMSGLAGLRPAWLAPLVAGPVLASLMWILTRLMLPDGWRGAGWALVGYAAVLGIVWGCLNLAAA